MKATFGLGKDWELTEISGGWFDSGKACYRLDLGNNRFLDIVCHRSGMGAANYDFGHCKMYYIRNGESWLVKKDSNLDECMMIGNDIADRKLDDNAIINYCYDQIFKKKEETKSDKELESVDENDSEDTDNGPLDFLDLVINNFFENRADISIDVDALKKSIEVNGHTSKSIVAMEELAELSQAVSKAHRYIDSNEIKVNSNSDLNTADILDNMAEEIADVLICIETLKIMYGFTDKDIQKWIDTKIERQKTRDRKMKKYRYLKEKKKMENNLFDEKTWEEFREAGMLWAVNTMLEHLFGWCIAYEYESGELKNVAPYTVAKAEKEGRDKLIRYLKADDTTDK